MNYFAGMEDLLSDFLIEAGEMLSDVESMLMELEESPGDSKLFNEIFRGFHTIKGGAGFLNASELVNLCHSIEDVFDKLRNSELVLSAELLDVIFAATAEVRRMFATLQQSQQPGAAPGEINAALQAALTGQKIPALAAAARPAIARAETAPPQTTHSSGVASHDSMDWNKLFSALTSTDFAAQAGLGRDSGTIAAAIYENDSAWATFGRRSLDVPGTTIGRRAGDVPATEAMGSTMRVVTERLDQVLNLSGEIGSARNRLAQLSADMIQGRADADTMNELDQAVGQLDKLVVSLQNAVKKTRMQPIGRLFKTYPRLTHDLSRSLGKDVELVLSGEYIEMDKTMIEDLHEPLLHLLRNAVVHGVETCGERIAAGKPEQGILELGALQEGEHVLIAIADDGRGMLPEVIRGQAVKKGLITSEMANMLDDAQCLELIFLPGLAGKDDIPGTSVCVSGMDLVKANIQKMNGVVNIRSGPGKGTVITIRLPLSLAIQPVLILRLGEQLFAVPLSMVREIISVTPDQLQQVSGRACILVRGEVLPVLPLAQLIGWEPGAAPEVGVLVQLGKNSYILSADSFAGHDEVVIKSMDIFRPRGVAGVAVSGEGGVVLVLDIKELLSDVRAH